MSLSANLRLTRGDFAVQASIDAAAGETLALLGPNGAGKSSIVAALAGALPLDDGRVELDGVALDDAAAGVHVPSERRSVGVVFQDLLLFPHLTALENVVFPLRASGSGRRAARERAADMLGRFGVANRATARPRDLSGGEAQRVALARALVHEPKLLLLDEPLSAVDAASRRRLRSLVRSTLSAFPGVRVIVTHDPVEAMTLADRVAVLENGLVTQTGTPDEIRTNPRSTFAADLAGVNLFRGRLQRLPDGAGLLVTGNGDVVVGWPPEGADLSGEVFGVLRPSDVSLHLDRPEGSERNVFPGRVVSVGLEGERAWVVLESSPPLAAEITAGSLARMGIVDGTSLWASFKAVEVAVTG